MKDDPFLYMMQKNFEAEQAQTKAKHEYWRQENEKKTIVEDYHYDQYGRYNKAAGLKYEIDDAFRVLGGYYTPRAESRAKELKRWAEDTKESLTKDLKTIESCGTLQDANLRFNNLKNDLQRQKQHFATEVYKLNNLSQQEKHERQLAAQEKLKSMQKAKEEEEAKVKDKEDKNNKISDKNDNEKLISVQLQQQQDEINHLRQLLQKSEDEKKNLAIKAAVAQNEVKNLNEKIKDISANQISKEEIETLKKAIEDMKYQQQTQNDQHNQLIQNFTEDGKEDEVINESAQFNSVITNFMKNVGGMRANLEHADLESIATTTTQETNAQSIDENNNNLISENNLDNLSDIGNILDNDADSKLSGDLNN